MKVQESALPREVRTSPRRDWPAVLYPSARSGRAVAQENAAEMLGRMKTEKRLLELAIRKTLVS